MSEMPEEVWLNHQEINQNDLDVDPEDGSDGHVKYIRADLCTQNTEAMEALKECVEVLNLSDWEGKRAKAVQDERIDNIIKSICEQFGYGAVMDSAARQWWLKDNLGSVTTGACSVTLKTTIKNAQKVLSGGDGSDGW